jgi:tRNA threonylcarbamoyladenosine biosynthesis protein TsaB
MYLALKTASNTSELTLVDGSGQEKERYSWESGRTLAELLLEEIKDLLKRNQLDWAQLEGLVVFEGPGSFTGLRIGITVANTIAYTRKIPIVGTRGDDWIKQGAERLAKGENDTQVAPFYDRQPNITRPGSNPA